MGCPLSFGFLSDTRLTILSEPPKLLMVSAEAFFASVSVFASLISLFVVSPAVEFALVITK